MKIRPLGAEFLHAERQTDRHDEANSCFWPYCDRAQKFVSQIGSQTDPYTYQQDTLQCIA